MRIGKTALTALLLAILLVAGGSSCAVLTTDAPEDDGTTPRMMDSDLAPLQTGEQRRSSSGRMPVPVEPSPFELGRGTPHAMQSDIEPPMAPVDHESGKRALPKEPIP